MLETSAMYQYTPGQNGDAELLAWYLRMNVDGDLDNLFGGLIKPLGEFIRNYTDPTTCLYYATDAQGWWFACWVQPFMGGGSWGAWCRPDKRGCPQAVSLTLHLHELAFQRFSTLMLATKQEAIVAKMERLGYTCLGAVPDLFGEGQAGSVMYLTRDDFQTRMAAWRNSIDKRGERVAQGHYE